MADLPDLIIRTTEELRGEDPFPLELVEARLGDGSVMMKFAENFTPDDDYIETQTWRFKTEKARLMFAAARIRDLRQDGVAEIVAPYFKIHSEHPDKRRSPDYSYDNPLGKPVRIRRSVPLVW